jgi:hypothetical protein
MYLHLINSCPYYWYLESLEPKRKVTQVIYTTLLKSNVSVHPALAPAPDLGAMHFKTFWTYLTSKTKGSKVNYIAGKNSSYVLCEIKLPPCMVPSSYRIHAF